MKKNNTSSQMTFSFSDGKKVDSAKAGDNPKIVCLGRARQVNENLKAEKRDGEIVDKILKASKKLGW